MKKKSVSDSLNWDQRVNVVRIKDQEVLEADQLVEMKTGVETIGTKSMRKRDPNVKLKLKLQERLKKNSMVKTPILSQLSEIPPMTWKSTDILDLNFGYYGLIFKSGLFLWKM